MTELENQQGRQQIILALLYATEHAPQVLEFCSSSTTDGDDLARALADATGLTPFQAEVILTMQVKRFTPRAIAQMRAELRDVERRIAELRDL